VCHPHSVVVVGHVVMLESIYNETMWSLGFCAVALILLIVTFRVMGRVQTFTMHDALILMTIRACVVVVMFGFGYSIYQHLLMLYRIAYHPHQALWYSLFG
jgi:hypothetical protein